MVKLKYIGLSICMIILMSVIAFSTPPRFWYGTYAVEDYEGNGCDDSLNCIYPHEHADGFHQGVQNHADSINFEYYQRDVEDDSCTADRWAGWYAETNYMDFLFYAGHGTGFGPMFGCDPVYVID